MRSLVQSVVIAAGACALVAISMLIGSYLAIVIYLSCALIVVSYYTWVLYRFFSLLESFELGREKHGVCSVVV